MAEKTKRNLYFVVGEPSGDALGAAIVQALNSHDILTVQAIGLGGPRLQAHGLQTLFEIDELSVMGIGPALKRLPSLVRRIGMVADDIVARQPDAVLLVDSPEFCAQVAKRVRKRAPHIPIVKYVCPSVWAWRPGRAKKMARYVDHILCLLPFEPEVLKRLNGPTGTYVGHPLTVELNAWRGREPAQIAEDEPKTVLLLPGSRQAEIARSLPAFLHVAQRLAENHDIKFILPTLAKREAQVREILHSARLSVSSAVEVVVGDDARRVAFDGSHAALATSGTISLELALAQLPHAIFYQASEVERQVGKLITSWSVNLPNLMLDEVLIPECVGEYAKPERLLREVAPLLAYGPARDRQVSGFRRLWKVADTDLPPSELAASALRKAANW
ncbi:MAG: lipid-A-disaccharide synthase [Pseudomonadota bacterium]